MIKRNEKGQFIKGNVFIYWKGKKISEAHRKKMSEAGKNRYEDLDERKKQSDRLKRAYLEGRKKLLRYWLGKKLSKSIRKKMSVAKTGENNPNWKGGVQKNERNDPAYHQWVRKVKSRDKQTCRINDENCSGYNIVHHIFGWLKYPKLRYELTNGITLCQFHHPRKRDKEELFRKLFSYLVKQK